MQFILSVVTCHQLDIVTIELENSSVRWWASPEELELQPSFDIGTQVCWLSLDRKVLWNGTIEGEWCVGYYQYYMIRIRATGTYEFRPANRVCLTTVTSLTQLLLTAGKNFTYL
jgi:hypothetical protein